MNYIITEYLCGRKINVNENTILFLARNAFSVPLLECQRTFSPKQSKNKAQTTHKRSAA